MPCAARGSAAAGAGSAGSRAQGESGVCVCLYVCIHARLQLPKLYMHADCTLFAVGLLARLGAGLRAQTQDWPEPYICTYMTVFLGTSLPKNGIYTIYIYMWFWPTHYSKGHSTRTLAHCTHNIHVHT